MEEQNKRQRKAKWKSSYSTITQKYAEERLNVRFTQLGNEAVRIDKLIDLSSVSCKTDEVKNKIYERVIELIETEDYPQGAIEPFKEASITDIVGTILVCVLAYFRRKEGRPNIKLRREKEIIAPDGETGGIEEYVVVDIISVTIDKIVLVVEAKRDNMDKCLAQCLLAMKDAYDYNIETKNNKKNIYGFTTEGIHWRLIVYDGKSFKMSDEIKTMAPDMATDKEYWMKNLSVIVDTIYYVLSDI